ncbi:LysR family transcriptional regulator [Oxalobacteraceae bacterium OM1]|nr:LysR family transcriptional regulator [Oxalobacteraceae bacterium OM1]
MDRIDAIKAFVTVLDEGSLAGAARKLDRSAAAISRALAFLEEHVGTELLHRTTRSIRPSEAGVRYAEACRRVLNELEEADREAMGQLAGPRGTLTITAPSFVGEEILLPVINAFLAAVPAVTAKVYFLDRSISLAEEGVDVGLRIGRLPDSSLVAINVGTVRRVIVASPEYLKSHPRIATPADLARHDIISIARFGHDSWRFASSGDGDAPQIVQFQPKLVVDSARAATASAILGLGLTRVHLYQVASAIQEGSLQIVLPQSENTVLPVHLVTPYGRLSVPKVRAFVDFAVPHLRTYFEQDGNASRKPFSAQGWTGLHRPPLPAEHGATRT